jgi:Autotransporter beta-domain
VSNTSENTVLQKTLSRILGCVLLLYGSTALAFTLITLPQEQVSPSNTVTDATTLEAQVQPIAGTIRAQLLGHLRPKGSAKVARVGGMLAANAYASSRSDVDYLAAAPSDSSGAGSGIGGGDSESVWISAATNSLENTFSRTAFYGATHNLLVGIDLTRSDKYVLGVSVGQEASNFVTTFNTGNEKTRGFNLNPYFALLLSDTWSLDLIGGYGQFNTNQSRAIGSLTVPLATVAVDSEFASKRGFISTNLTNVSTWGNWKLTGSLGYLASKRENDAYVESDGNAVAASKLTSEQWNLLGEAAYGRGNSEAFFGAMYENTRDPQNIVFTTGEQPANDPDSVLLTAGWRHFGKGLTASFVFSSRVAQEQVKDYGFSMMLRIDL